MTRERPIRYLDIRDSSITITIFPERAGWVTREAGDLGFRREGWRDSSLAAIDDALLCYLHHQHDGRHVRVQLFDTPDPHVEARILAEVERIREFQRSKPTGL